LAASKKYIDLNPLLHFSLSCRVALLFSLSFVGFAGCGAELETGLGKTSVVVSIAPHAYLVERIGGDHVQVTTLVQPGESPATYQPSDQQVSEVMKSQVFFRTGVPFEKGKWLEAILHSGKAISIVDLREGITLREFKNEETGLEERGSFEKIERHGEGEVHDEIDEHHDCDHGHDHEGADPHIWLSPSLLKIQAQTMARALKDMYPERSRVYQTRLTDLISDLDQVDTELRQLLAPFKGKSIYVYHPAWGYFCDAYGLKQVAIEHEGKEPSDQELTAIHKRIKAEGGRVIFVQPQISGESAKAAAGSMGVEIQILDPLSKDVIENLRSIGRAIAGSF
jgi:zinc transport system substrate-binding protein